MPLFGFDHLLAQTDASADRKRVVAAGGNDPTVLEAMGLAASRGWISPVVTGPQGDIAAVATQVGVSLANFRVIDCAAEDVAAAAVAAIRAGECQMLMKGQVPTPLLMKAVLDRDAGLRSGKTICQMVLMEIPRDQRRFLMTDTGITVNPTVEQKIELVEHALATAAALGEPEAAVALLAATEKATAAMPETLDAEAVAAHFEHRSAPPSAVSGPLSFDLAYSRDAAGKKNIGGRVVGAADAMVFPNLLSANLTVKGMMYAADCRFGGILRGTTHPVVFMSRADNVATRLHSLALALTS